MSVASSRRRLLAARRYAARQLIPAQRPVADWAVLSTPWDSGSALRAVERLARRKEANAIHSVSAGCDSDCDCDGVWCPWHVAMMVSSRWYDIRYAAESRLRPPSERDPQHPRIRDERTEQ